MAGVGIAEGKFVAWTAAVTSEPGQVCTVPESKEGEFLQPLDVSLLPASPDTLRRLDLYGLRTMGDLASLPPGPLQAQFGGEGMRLWESPAASIASRCGRAVAGSDERDVRFPTAAVSVEALVVACRRLLVRLHWQLRGRAARRLRLRAALWGGRVLGEDAHSSTKRSPTGSECCLSPGASSRTPPLAGAGGGVDYRVVGNNGGARPPVDAVRGESGTEAAARRDGAPATGALGTASRIAGGGGRAVVATAGEASRPYRLRAVTA